MSESLATVLEPLLGHLEQLKGLRDYFTWRELLDILLVSFIFYRLMLLVRGTRAVPVLYGLVLVTLLYYGAGQLGLTTLHWMLQNFLGSIFLVIIILFQADIRKGLAEIGAGGFFAPTAKVRDDTVEAVVQAMGLMASQRIGALIVMERAVPLGDILDRGVALGARLSPELLVTIFYPDTPLHDGAVVVRKGQVVAAGCILPLTSDPELASKYGTRHRAAIGLTEETDTLVLVVSEERGTMSAAYRGRLIVNLDETRLTRIIRNVLSG